MKLRAFAVIAALALPGLASATPADRPPTNPPITNPPSDQPTPDQAPISPPVNTPTDKAPTDKAPTDKAPADKGAKLSDGDVKIIAHLHSVNQMEINLAQLAQKVGTAHVKDYAKTIVTDHQSADKDLTAFAKTHKLAAIPADKPMTDADRQDDKDMTAAMARIKTLKGAEFDKQYINMMVAGHDKELSKIDVSISGAGDADLKTILQGVKPVLQRHADQARDLQKSPQAAIEPNKPMDPNKPVDKLPSQR
jgi:putative membrane protein